MPDEQSQRLVIGVTGATGCIGGMLVRHLLRFPSVEVRALVRRPGVRREPGLSIRTGDLCTRGALESLVAESDVVLHLAAQNPISAAEDGRQLATFLATNSFGTGAVAFLADAYGKPLVYTSSVSVYELSGGNSGPLTEDESLPGRPETNAWSQTILEGLNDLIETWGDEEVEDVEAAVTGLLRKTPMPEKESAYGLTKLLGEHWVMERANGLVLRLSDVYGPGHERRGLLQECLGRILQRGRVSLDFGRRARVSFVFLGDVLQALLRAVALAKKQESHVLNVAHPVSVTPAQLRDALLTVDGSLRVAVRAPPGTYLPGSDRSFATERAERLLGMRWTSLRDGIRETTRYLRMPSPEREAYQFPDLQL